MNPLYLPALSGQLGTWDYYACLMRLGDVRERISYASEIHQIKSLSDMIQRAAYRHARDQMNADHATTTALDWERPQVDLVAPLASVSREPGPWWSSAARRAKKESREEFVRGKAWDQFARHADWAAARIAVARGASEGFLRGLPADPGLLERELAVALRQRVPEIIAEAVEACRGVPPSEARALTDEGLELLELLAAEAERRRPIVAGGAGSRLATKRAYVEEVVRRGRPS